MLDLRLDSITLRNQITIQDSILNYLSFIIKKQYLFNLIALDWQ